MSRRVLERHEDRVLVTDDSGEKWVESDSGRRSAPLHHSDVDQIRADPSAMANTDLTVDAAP